MSTSDAVPDEIVRQLHVNEKVVWWGRPLQGVVVRVSDVIGVLFGVAWLVGVFVFYRDAMAGQAPIGVLLLGVPFALVGAYLAGGHFFFESAKRTANALRGYDSPHLRV